MNRKVLFVKFHQNVFVPGIAELGNTFPAQGKTLNELDMSLVDSHILIKFSYKGLKKELALHSANASVIELAAEDRSSVVKMSKVS